MHEGEISLKLGLTGNPDIAESTMIYRDLSIAKYVSGRIHVPHVSSYKSIDIIERFKKEGLNVTAEVTPHHLCFTDEILTNLADTHTYVRLPNGECIYMECVGPGCPYTVCKEDI